MAEIERLFAIYGLLLVFVTVFLDEGGLPLPAFVVLLVAVAAANARPFFLGLILAVAVVAALVADLLWYWAGHVFGRRIQSLLCRISFSPDTCVRQTEDLFNRVGPASLLIVRYLPGLTNITVAMAAISRISLSRFLLYDTIGAILYFGMLVVLGTIFHRAIDQVVNTLFAFGRWGLLAVAIAIFLYVGQRWWQRMSFIRQLKMDRISVEELIEMIDAGNIPIILDVRTERARLADGIIPGALAAHPNDLQPLLTKLQRDTEIVVYCSCPNEASAATAARHLKKAGFKRIRPLLGGVEAWLGAGRKLDAPTLFHQAEAAADPSAN
jgi:membrane protein DedA with SNARE-associated domain/rhodanese-related sulfurtransferase